MTKHNQRKDFRMHMACKCGNRIMLEFQLWNKYPLSLKVDHVTQPVFDDDLLMVHCHCGELFKGIIKGTKSSRRGT